MTDMARPVLGVPFYLFFASYGVNSNSLVPD
jgi:hypothetical protein|nr:MAG TPA: hypothetical protein [Caudoviricetes sp.]DAQ00096.1 MAG TPA: hypothetical protein [Caudoviricetes sp.]